MSAAKLAALTGATILLAGSSPTPSVADTEIAQPAASQPLLASAGERAKRVSVGTLTPAAAAQLERLAQRTSDASAAAVLFASHSWYVAPPPPPPPAPAAPAAPTAPPLPYSFVGSYAPVGADAVYFLVRGDRVYDVKPGATLDGTYSFDAVENGQLIFTYKPLNIRQTLAVGGGT